MNFKFPKKLFFASVVALGIASFTACGGSNDDPVGPSGTSSSSMDIPTPPQNTETTAIKFNGIAVSSQTATKVKFTGSIDLDFSDTNTVVDVNAVRFTKIDFTLHTAATVIPTRMINPPDYDNSRRTSVNLLETGLLAEPTECGPMTLVISAYATDGIKESITTDSITFVRDESYCVDLTPSSSSVAAPSAPLTSYTVKLNTKDTVGVMLATGAKTTDQLSADLAIVRSGGTVIVTGSNGMRFAEDISNTWFDTNLPNPATVSSFDFYESELSSSLPDFFETRGSLFYVAVSPEYNAASGSAVGFYAFTVLDFTKDSNDDVEMTLIIYKAAQ